ncbi:polysaccharide pyruvyl transferase family protein [bacterium RCC_150]
MTNRTNQLWLMGAYGNGNLGDDMLGDLARRSLELSVRSPKIFAGDYFPFERAADHGRRAIFSNVRGGDQVLIAGGGLLNDHFGYGFLKLFASLAVVLRLKRARHSFIGIGVEGFTTRFGAFLGFLATRLASSVSVRDKSSQEHIESIGVKARVIPDLGWLARRHLPKADLLAERRIVVLSIAIERESMRESRELLIKNAAAQVLRDTNMDVVLVAMQSSALPALDDCCSLRSIQEMLGSTRVSVARPRDYRELYPLLQKAKVVAGFRLHAGVLGVVAGSRVVALSRSHKVREALSGLVQCTVVDEGSAMIDESGSFLDAIAEACSLPPVKGEELAIVDEYCRIVETELVSGVDEK